MDTGSEQSAREALSGLAQRLPRYAELSARLVAEGRLSAGQQAPLLGGLRGVPVAGRLIGLVPFLGQLTTLLGTLGAIRYALEQMQAEAADAHLAAVGLSRAEVEADVRQVGALVQRVKAVDAEAASELMRSGARKAGRLVGRGLRAFRAAQAAREPAPPTTPAALEPPRAEGGDGDDPAAR